MQFASMHCNFFAAYGFSIYVNIVTAYLQLLYSSDIVEVSRQKVNLSELQLERISKIETENDIRHISIAELIRTSIEIYCDAYEENFDKKGNING